MTNNILKKKNHMIILQHLML